MSTLAVAGVSVAHGAHTVLHDVSLSIERGETVALVGASGSGKTTLLRAVLGLVPLVRGTVTIDGNVASRDGDIVVRPEQRNLAAVFQEPALWPNMTVRGNLAFALGARAKNADERIATMLEHVGLAAHAARMPRELSGGEARRVSLARALVVEPTAIVLDEPLTNLDVLLRKELLELVRRTFDERKATALYVTHDPREARALARRIAVLDGGTIVQCGTWDELAKAPASPLVQALIEGG